MRSTPIAILGLAVVLASALVTWSVNSSRRRMPTGDALLDPRTAPPSAFAWTRLPDPAFPIPPYAQHLEGVTIVLDPGHGGRANRPNWKRGPTGLREAEVNLRVAQYLREFLESVGTSVVLTREEDVYLHESDAEDLRLRAEVANRINADLLLSIHHNAVGDPDVNFTTIFYHGEPDEMVATLAAARHVLAGLTDALRLKHQSECALRSDYTIYPGKGFAVLRHARVPAVLSEASFHSNPLEEQRLRDALYNRREAYGLFLGLARWAHAGLPRVELVSDTAKNRDRKGAGKHRRREIVLHLHDGLRDRERVSSNVPTLLASTIQVRLNGDSIPYRFDRQRQTLMLELSGSARGRELYVNFLNVFGQPVLHPRVELP